MAILLTFSSIHFALAAERAAKAWEKEEGGGPADLVPLPPQVRSDCGFGLLVEGVDRMDSVAIGRLIGSGRRFEAVYAVVESGGGGGGRKERRYERIDTED